MKKPLKAIGTQEENQSFRINKKPKNSDQLK